MNDSKQDNEKYYDVIISPVITEKATMASSFNQVVFRVATWANKAQIREAIENLFKVEVKRVNTLVHKGKLKNFRGHVGRRKDTKKAIITLAEGQSIDVTTGL